MIFILLSISCTSVMDAYGHVHANVTTCFLNEDLFFGYCNKGMTLNINSYSRVIQYSLNAIGYMFLYTSLCMSLYAPRALMQ